MLKDDEHLSGAESLSTFDLALSIHSAAPRIEAQYQFYESSVKPALENLNISVSANWVEAAKDGAHSDIADGDLSTVHFGL